MLLLLLLLVLVLLILVLVLVSRGNISSDIVQPVIASPNKLCA